MPAAKGKARTAVKRRVRKTLAADAATPLMRWQKQRDKLLAAIEGVRNAPTMQGEEWKQGQLRHFEKLLAQLDASKPGA